MPIDFQLREVALSYHSCRNDSRLFHLLSGIQYGRWDGIVRRLDLLENCRHYTLRQRRQPPASRHCCVTVATSNRSAACDLCVTLHPSHPQYNQQSCPLLSVPVVSQRGRPYSCLSPHRTYHPGQSMSLCCNLSSLPDLNSSSLQVHNTSTDPYILQHNRLTCHKMRVARSYGWIPPIQTDKSAEHLLSNISSLGCQGNSSLNFFMMDSRNSHMFAEQLGVESRAAVIVNIKVRVVGWRLVDIYIFLY